jgi:hypothetical protein
MPLTGDAPLSLLLPEVGELVSLSVLNTNYETINTYGVDNDTRVTAVETLNSTQNGRLTALETEDTALDGRLDVLEGQTLDARSDSGYSPNNRRG